MKKYNLSILNNLMENQITNSQNRTQFISHQNNNFKCSVQHLYQILSKNTQDQNGKNSEFYDICKMKRLSLKFNKVKQKDHQSKREYTDVFYRQNQTFEKSPEDKIHFRTSLLQKRIKSNNLRISFQKRQIPPESINQKLKSIIFRKKTFNDSKNRLTNKHNKFEEEPQKRIQMQTLFPQLSIQTNSELDLTRKDQVFFQDISRQNNFHLKTTTTNSELSNKRLRVKGSGYIGSIQTKTDEKKKEKKSISKSIEAKQKIEISVFKHQQPLLIDTTKMINIKKARFITDLEVNQKIIIKMKELVQFNKLINYSFHSTRQNCQLEQLKKYNRKKIIYKYYIGAGNNRQLVVQTMKKRWWWKQTSLQDNPHFIWTQKRLAINKVNQNVVLFEKKNQFQERNTMNLFSTSKINKTMLQNAKNLLVPYMKNGNIQRKRQEELDNAESFYQMQYHNHLKNGNLIGDKKSLYRLIRLWTIQYKSEPSANLFLFIPETYNIETLNDTQYHNFNKLFSSSNQKNNLWIVKPGENSNRGRGIFISNSLQQINEAISNRQKLAGTTIIQRYISNLTLYKGRKFDIRTYLLNVTIQGKTKFYWYAIGYIRTSSYQFQLQNLQTMIHLTNDAIQCQNESYGRFEKGNKLSYHQFKQYLKEISEQQKKFDNLVIKMKTIAKKIAQISYYAVDKQKNYNSFELFGMDFLIDDTFNPWLLQVNTNPCLQTSSLQLQKIIPSMIENVCKIAVDPIFQANMYPDKIHEHMIPEKIVENNKFQLIFDSLLERDVEWQAFLQQNWNKVS